MSWRVHILPYLEAQPLYEEFHLDEPWDSPHNKKLIAEMPDVFANPALDLDEGMTCYLGVTGQNAVLAAPNAPSPNGKMPAGVRIAEITDGTSNTLLVVEANQDNAVIWTKPDDFDATEIDDFRSVLEGTWPGNIIHLGMCDGSVRSSGAEITNEILQLMITFSDGKPIEIDDN